MEIQRGAETPLLPERGNLSLCYLQIIEG